MNFREYKIGSRMFAVALGGSMCITLLLPSLDIASVKATEVSIDKQLTDGYETGWNIYDPLMLGQNKPIKVQLKVDPKTNQPIDPMYAYVYQSGVPFPSGINHPNILGADSKAVSIEQGKINEARRDQGAVFVIRTNEQSGPYIENADRHAGLAAGRGAEGGGR